MTRKRRPRARGGWVLAEILCSAVIVSMIAAHITESSGMMIRTSASGLETRTRALDFNSIAGEAECTVLSGGVFRGSWQASADVYAGERGIGRVEISVSLSSGELLDAVRWVAWDIKGRAR